MRNLRPESEIISGWRGDPNKPIVSICCIAYNHGRFIMEALNGFLIQETIFPFEILIHDDASEDKTPEIIKSYAERYPNIIKPIFQDINQYSKKVKINATFNFPRAAGKFIGLCEGDDYWVSPNKIQEQVLILEQFPHINLTCHPAFVLRQGCIEEKLFGYKGLTNRTINPTSVILGGGGFAATSSLLFRRSCISEIIEFMNVCPVGDMPTQNIASISGRGCFYLAELRSVYRRDVPGSWSSSQNSMNIVIGHYLALLVFYKKLAIAYPRFSLIIGLKLLWNGIEMIRKILGVRRWN